MDIGNLLNSLQMGGIPGSANLPPYAQALLQGLSPTPGMNVPAGLGVGNQGPTGLEGLLGGYGGLNVTPSSGNPLSYLVRR